MKNTTEIMTAKSLVMAKRDESERQVFKIVQNLNSEFALV
jgi:hypothetical protein